MVDTVIHPLDVACVSCSLYLRADLEPVIVDKSSSALLEFSAGSGTCRWRLLGPVLYAARVFLFSSMISVIFSE